MGHLNPYSVRKKYISVGRYYFRVFEIECWSSKLFYKEQIKQATIILKQNHIGYVRVGTVSQNCFSKFWFQFQIRILEKCKKEFKKKRNYFVSSKMIFV